MKLKSEFVKNYNDINAMSFSRSVFIFKDIIYINIVMLFELIFIRSNDKIFFFAPQLFENLI